MKTHHHDPRLSLAALGVCLLLASNSVRAQLKAQDVAGFALGQTVAEVESTLRSRYPDFLSAKVYVAGSDGKASSTVSGMVMGRKPRILEHLGNVQGQEELPVALGAQVLRQGGFGYPLGQPERS